MAEDHPSPSKSGQDTSLQLLEQFVEIFKCTICLMKLDDPHLCPQCSKFYCYDCISEWLLSESEQHLYCPNCTCELQLDKLVKVRWFEEAEKLQRNCLQRTATAFSTNKLTTSSDDTLKEDICSKHMKDILFYCCSCKFCVCYECWNEDHLDHKFKILDVIYDGNLDTVEEEFDNVRQHTKKIASLVEKVERNVELVNKVEKDKLQEIRAFAEKAIEGIKRQANDMRRKLEQHKSTLMTEMQDNEQSLVVLEEEVKASSRSQLIVKKSRIVKECNKVLTIPIKDLKQIRVPISFKIETPIIHQTGSFVVEKFSTLNNGKRVYSNKFTDCFGHIWRIFVVIYISEGQVGVFLELVKGSSCRAECRIQLLHPDHERIIDAEITERSFDAAPTNVWGFRNFVTMQTIYDDKFLEDDSLQLVHHFRPLGGIEIGTGQ